MLFISLLKYTCISELNWIYCLVSVPDKPEKPNPNLNWPGSPPPHFHNPWGHDKTNFTVQNKFIEK